MIVKIVIVILIALYVAGRILSIGEEDPDQFEPSPDDWGDGSF